MNNTKLITVAFVALSFCMISSCGDDDSPSNNVDCSSSLEVNRAVADDVEAIGIAIQAWIVDQSPQNCNALQTAYQNYIDALESLQDCANQAGVGQEFSQALSEAQNNIADLSC